MLYGLVALVDQTLKLGLNVCRGWVAESTVRSLRTALRVNIVSPSGRPSSTADAGAEIAMMLDEAEPIGGFTGLGVSEPLLQGAINRRAKARILTKRETGGTLVEGVVPVPVHRPLAAEPIERVFTLDMGIYRLKYFMNLLMNLMHHLSVAVALSVGGWLALEGHIEVGTVVAVVGGLGKLNDPWGDLVNWGRELSVVSVKYRLFAGAAARLMAAARPAP